MIINNEIKQTNKLIPQGWCKVMVPTYDVLDAMELWKN